MGKCINLIGQKFGRLTVIKRLENNKHKNAVWLCKCECENFTSATTASLKSGKVKSCGCLKIDQSKLKKENKYNLSGEFGIGYTSKDEEFYFDLEDYDKIKDYCWYISTQGYLVSNISDTKRTCLIMHRLIMEAGNYDIVVDHINHNKKDNRKENLRLVNRRENNWNRNIAIDSLSGRIGVHWDKSRNKWRATLKKDGKNHTLGRFDNLEDAIKAREKAEREYYGEYAFRANKQQQKKAKDGE